VGGGDRLRFQVVMGTNMKARSFWDISLCGIGPTIQRCVLPPSSGMMKRRSTPTRVHGATSQKDLIFEPQVV
jgi:hypothetical protein